MKINELFKTLTLILVVLMIGCKEDDYKATVGVCPLVISTIPANGAVGVPLNQVVSATFNEKMNPSTINSSSFTVVATNKSLFLNSSTAIAGVVTYSGVTAFFTPSSPLTPNTTYTGRVTTAAHDPMGNALQTDYVWTFATDLPPTVTIDPANNATGVLLNKVIVATFSVPMDSLTIKSPATNFTVKQGTTTIPGKFSFAGRIVSFTPTSNLAPFTVYTVAITTGVKNTLGTAMAADVVSTFTTIPQLSLSANPILGGTTLGAGLFVQGSSVTATATANAGYTFFNWTDGATVVSTNASYQFLMAGNKNLVANFSPKYLVTLLSNPILAGTTLGGGSFNSGSTVTVIATPNSGYTFFNWTDGTTVASTSATYSFTLTGNRTLVANFTPKFVVTLLANPILGGTTSGGGTFNSGATATAVALPNAGFTFSNWTDGVNVVSTSLTYQFAVTGNRTLVANFDAIPYTVAVSSNPLLGGTTTGGGTFVAGASVTVAATPNAGFTFANWTEGLNIVSTSANYLFTLTGNRTLVANYTAIPYAVIVSSNPILGGVTTGGGTYAAGTLVTVLATPNAGYTFSNWTEGVNIVSTRSDYQFTIEGNRTLVANYNAIIYSLAVSSKPLLGGTTTGGGNYNSGSLVTAKAVANVGYTFTNWTEGLNIVSSNADYQFTITGNRVLEANYSPITYSVAVSSNPLIGGSTTGGGTFNSGATVTVNAVANAGYTFTNWTEGLIVASTNATYLFNIAGNRILVANYAKDFNLVITAVNGSVVKNPNQLTYKSGTAVQLTAVPNSGYNFTSWSGDATGTLNPLTIIMNSDKAITANFTAITGSAPLFSTKFGIFGGTAGMTNQGTLTQIVGGDIGTIATGTTAITGFHDSLGDIYTETGSNIGGVSGLILSCTVSTTGPTSAGVNAANCNDATVGRNAILDAYNTLAGMPVSGVLLPANLSGLTVTAGVYKAPGGSFMIQDGLPGPAGDLTLSGTATDVWVFQMSTSLTVGGPGAAFPRSVKLTGGALAKNVYWQVGSAATINAGGGGTMEGTIIAQQGVSISTAGNVAITTLNGRALSLIASVTVVNTIINVPAP